MIWERIRLKRRIFFWFVGGCRVRCDAYVHRMNYCIFSTLPLDVENTAIHTLNAEGVGFCEMECYVEFEGGGFL